MEKIFEIVKPVNGEPMQAAVIAFHAIIVFLAIILLGCLIALLVNTTREPSAPIGWSDKNYDAIQGSRKSLVEYIASKSIPDTTPMNHFAIATANFGGIYTEDMALLSPWIGRVDPEAARLQVEAGARALVADIWPDPATRKPVVCSMLDTQSWHIQQIWMNGGLNKGVNRYSNWNSLTRNRAPAGTILNATIKAAFEGPTSRQNSDPFFLILKLHGPMPKSYLDELGDIVRTAIGGHAMGTEWDRALNQNSIGTAPLSAFASKVFVIVVPEIPPSTTQAAFINMFLTTRMGEVTNSVERTPNSIFFEPTGIAAIGVATQTNCVNPAGPPQTLSQTAFTVVQPSTGGKTTNNDVLFGEKGLTECIQVGAHFTAVNLFSPNPSDTQMSVFFDPAYFGTYSFRKL
jgi:hypothetical protein